MSAENKPGLARRGSGEGFWSAESQKARAEQHNINKFVKGDVPAKAEAVLNLLSSNEQHSSEKTIFSSTEFQHKAERILANGWNSRYE